MRITLCADCARRFKVTHDLTELANREAVGKCSFCSCAGTLYEATPKEAPKPTRPQRKKPPYIQNKEKQMQRRRWA